MENPYAQRIPLSILVVEGNVNFAASLSNLLRDAFKRSTRIDVVFTLEAAIKYLENEDVDVILLDVELPDGRGIKAIWDLQAISRAAILALASFDDKLWATKLLEAGVEDCLFKRSVTSVALGERITFAVTRHRSSRKARERVKIFEQREEFMATLAHDLKNPLLGTNRILELMASNALGQLPDQHTRLLHKVMESNESLLSLLRTLMDVYRYDKDSNVLCFERIDLLAMIHSYLDSVKLLWNEKEIDVKVTADKDINSVWADGNSILRVIQNLVDNAIKFTPVGGKIEIRLWSESGNTLIRVSDTGPGISTEERERLFERFYQGSFGKQYSAGTGLGLYLCRQIVEAHSGEIWCDSSIDQGSSFTFKLPAEIAS